MIVPVKFLVNSRVFDSEISAKIDNPRPGAEQWFSELSREPVRQREKDEFGFARDLFRIRIGKLERSRSLAMNKTRKNFRERFAGQISRSCCYKIDMRMREKQAHEFLPGVTGGANDGDLRLRHNAQCVFALARFATNIIVTIKTFRALPFSVTSRTYGCSLSCRDRGACGLRVRLGDHSF